MIYKGGNEKSIYVMDLVHKNSNVHLVYVSLTWFSRAAIDILNISLNLLDAVCRVGMSAEKLRWLVACFGGLQNLHESDHFIGIISSFIHETNAKFVRLKFVIAAEFQGD